MAAIGHGEARSPLPPFQWLLDAYAGPVLRYLVGQVGATEADDCFQETMLAALRAYPTLTHGSNLRAWLLTIAKRKALDSFRTSARRPVSIEATTTDIPVVDPATPDADLWDRVQGLPEKQRRAVGLRFAADRPYGEIARTLSMSEEAARRNVHEGIKRLRREMHDDDR